MVETWIAPTGHNPSIRFKTRDFGPDARVPVRSLQLAWFDWWFKRPNALERADPPSPKLHIFVMGPNVWRDEHEWPLARTRYTPLYLSSHGHANSVEGDGGLSWQTVPRQPPDQFTYDPKNPVPTIGGAICCNAKLMPPGPLDQSPVEGRKDVWYTRPPRSPRMRGDRSRARRALYIHLGERLRLYGETGRCEPGGRPLLVTNGIQRLRYRLSLDKPVFVKRDTTYRIGVDAG